MKCFPITFVLVVVAETLLAAVISGLHFTDGQEVEENLIISKRRGAAEHDHRTDSAYAGILNDKDEIEALKHLEPFEVMPRMKTILESMDQNKNGFIEKNELSARLMETYKKLSAEESDAEFEASDHDENNFITWKEYVSVMYASNDDSEDEMTKEEKELFLGADTDNDGQLSKTEFQYFYTPEDYPHMKPFLINGLMDRFDADKDGKVTFDEFIGERKSDHNSERLQEENTKFTEELDLNNDGVLDEEELHNWASPNNYMIAESEAEKLIDKSDENKDGILSFDEVLDNYVTFISPESEGYYIFRDEL